MTVSLLGLLVLSAILIVCYIATAVLSSRGSLTRTKPRDKVVILAYIVLVISVLEVGWLVFSTYAAVSAYMSGDADTEASGMDSELEGVASGMGAASGMGVASGLGGTVSDGAMECSVIVHFCVSVGLAWLVNVLVLLLTMCGLDPCGCFLATSYIKHIINSHKFSEEEHEDVLQRSLTDYSRLDHVRGRYTNYINSAVLLAKLRQMFCFVCRRDGLNHSRRSAIKDVVKVLWILFNEVDVTFSDILAGFLLASRYQRNLRMAGKNREYELTKVS